MYSPALPLNDASENILHPIFLPKVLIFSITAGRICVSRPSLIIPATQPAAIEWHNGIRRSTPAVWGKKPKATTKMTLRTTN